MPERRRGLVETKDAIDDRFQPIDGDRGVHALELAARSDEHALQARLLGEQPIGAAGRATPVSTPISAMRPPTATDAIERLNVPAPPTSTT